MGTPIEAGKTHHRLLTPAVLIVAAGISGLIAGPASAIIGIKKDLAGTVRATPFATMGALEVAGTGGAVPAAPPVPAMPLSPADDGICITASVSGETGTCPAAGRY